MIKFILGVAAAAALSFGAGSAVAMPYKSAPRAGCAQFGGWYGGVNVGWASLDSKWVDRDAWVDNFSNDWALGTVSNSKSGVNAGGQLGYNLQSGCTVLGFETDANWTGIKSTKTYSPTAAAGTTLTLDSKVNWYGTLRARTGVVVDNLMMFVTGGFAYANIKHDFSVTDPIPVTESFGASRNRWGGVIGVGTEYALSSNLSLKSEFLYIRFNEVTRSVFSAAGAQTVHFDNQDAMWVSRVGLNWKFGL